MRRSRLTFTLLALLAPRVAFALTDDFTTPLSAQWAEPRAEEPGASVSAPVADEDAADGQVLELLFPGGTSLDDSGPAFASEVETADPQGYGTYTARIRTPKAPRSAGLVSAFFTYFNDGIDHDGDTIDDNHEIDIELLAAEPTTIYMTVWTEYEYDGVTERIHKTTRKIDLKKGRVWQTPAGAEDTYDLEEIAPLAWTAKRYRAWRDFYTYRFVWSPTSVEYSIDLGDGMGFRTLWTFAGAANVDIPSIPAPLLFNVWHNKYHWNSGKESKVPRRDAPMHVDSVSVE